MRMIEGLRSESVAESVVAQGMFDGVHLGHQALLQACRRHADQLGLPAVTLTYEPHPLRVLHPEAPPRLLTPLPEKLERLEAQGMDIVVIAEFTPAFSQLSPEQFVCDVMGALNPTVFVAGYRATFGRGGAGNAERLRELGAGAGFTVEIVPPVKVGEEVVSSTRIRQALEGGDVETAAAMLSYPYRVIGIVTRGDERGRTLGFPTANLEVSPEKLLPGDGVYAGEVCVRGMTYRAVMNIGARPTFDRPRSLEVHLIDFDGDLYGMSLSVRICRRLRDIRRFAAVDQLQAQIRQDVEQARDMML